MSGGSLQAVSRRRLAILLLVLLTCAAVAGGTGNAKRTELKPVRWHPDVAGAKRYASRRAGDVAFAVIDWRGRIQGSHRARTAPAASVFKVMLLVALLRKRHDAGLSNRDRALLGPMIRRSDNVAASTIRDLVGPRRIKRLARVARMRDFRYHPVWGQS